MCVGKVSGNRENPFNNNKKYMTAELCFLMTVDSHFLQKLLKNAVSFSVYHIKCFRLSICFITSDVYLDHILKLLCAG